MLVALASFALTSCGISQNQTIDIGSGLSLLSSIHDYAQNNELVGKNYSLQMVTSVYRSAESLDGGEDPLSQKSVTVTYDKSQDYFLTYEDGIVKKGFAFDTNGNYLIQENGVGRLFDNSKDSALLPFVDIPGYFVNLTMVFCDDTTGYLSSVNNNEPNNLTSYSLASSGSGSLTVHLAGKSLDYNACFADADPLISNNVTALKGEVAGSYLTSLTASYPCKVDGVSRQGKCVMSLRYSA